MGGGVRSLEDASALLEAGADKVSLNSAAVAAPQLIAVLARKFGSQCVVLAIDGKQTGPGRWTVLTRSGANDTGRDVVQWAKEGGWKAFALLSVFQLALSLFLATLGAGEILLTSLDRDGTRQGFDW